MINDRIRRARLLRGMSLEALALSLGDITKQGLSKYEKRVEYPELAAPSTIGKGAGGEP